MQLSILEGYHYLYLLTGKMINDAPLSEGLDGSEFRCN